MDDYIKREDAHDKVRWLTRYVNKEIRDQHGVNEMVDYDEVQAGLDKIPAVDVRENVRGRWHNVTISRMGNSAADCSICGATVYDSFTKHMPPRFCPNCGAYMEEDRDDGSRQDQIAGR